MEEAGLSGELPYSRKDKEIAWLVFAVTAVIVISLWQPEFIGFGMVAFLIYRLYRWRNPI